MCVVPLPFQTFVQRALHSGIIFLMRRHRKLGRTRLVDTVHSSRSRLCVPSSFGISNRNRNRSVSKFANYVRPPFTHARPFHKTRADISRVNRGFHNSSKLTLDRACILYWEAKQLGDRVGFERAGDKIRWSSTSLNGK